MKARLMMLLLALALGAFVAAGCGGDDDEGSAQETAPTETAQTPANDDPQEAGGEGRNEQTTELQIAADPGGALKFDKESLEAPAGEVTIVMENPSTLPHAVEIEGGGADAKGETVTQGGTSTATANLQPGEHRYFCPVAGHGEAGMEGTLTVE